MNAEKELLDEILEQISDIPEVMQRLKPIIDDINEKANIPERKLTDIKDMWIEKGEESKYLHEGDLVLLHDWGSDNSDQIIGVAYIKWDEESHGWDFHQIAGRYVDCYYDMWRQSPRKIGKITDIDDLRKKSEHIDQFTNKIIIDKDFEKYDGDWEELIEEEKLKANLKFHKKEIEKKKKNLNKKIKEQEELLKHHKEEVEKLEKELKNLKK